MNLRASVKYQLSEYKKAILIFYFVLVCLILFVGVTATIGAGEESSLNGLELSTIIFLFVLGLNSFKETFRMFMQNSVSRKTLFIGRMLSLVGTSIGMGIIDFTLLNIMKASNLDDLIIKGIFEQGYTKHIEDISSLQMYAESFIFQILLYLAFATVGYFITTAYYRMNKMLKVAVSVGVPVCFVMIIPTIDATVTNGKIFRLLYRLIEFAFGFRDSNPYHALVTFMLMFIVFGGLSWLLIRKAVDKD